MEQSNKYKYIEILCDYYNSLVKLYEGSDATALLVFTTSIGAILHAAGTP
jgi:hypothetical protein